MLRLKLLKRFVFSTVLSFLALVVVGTAISLPTQVYGLALPCGIVLTVLYWFSLRKSSVCPTCGGTGKIEVRHGRYVDTEYCPSCGGEGRVQPAQR